MVNESIRKIARSALLTAGLLACAAAPIAGADDGPKQKDFDRCVSFGSSWQDCCYWVGGTYTKHPDGGQSCHIEEDATSVGPGRVPGPLPTRETVIQPPDDQTQLAPPN